MTTSHTWFGAGLTSISHPQIRLQDIDMSTLFALIAQGDGRARIGFSDARARVHDMTQRDFFRRSAGLTHALAAGGVERGDYVVVACPAPEAALSAYAACVLHGARPVLFPARPGFDSRERIAESLYALLAQVPGDPPVVLQHDRGTPALALPASVRTIAIDLATLAPRDVCLPNTIDRDGIAHLQATSGSTGTPKLAALTSANLLANTTSALERMEIGIGDTYVSWLPLFHDLGLVGMALNAIVGGSNLYLLSPFDFAKNPFGWLKAISDQRGTITATPNFGLALAMRRVSDAQLAQLDLSSMRRVYCGAEPIDGWLAAQFTERFGAAGLPSDALRPTYGLAEATLMVSMPHMDERGRYVALDPHDVARMDEVRVNRSGLIADLIAHPPESGEAIVVSVGSAGPGTDVRIIDEDGSVVTDDGRCGEIVVCGPSVAPGYVAPDGTIEPFDAAGLRTGDVGFWYQGDVYVVERTKNMIIRNGANYAPNVLELELARRSDVPISDIAVLDSDLRPGHGRIVAAICLPKTMTPTSAIAAARAMAASVEPPLEELVFLQRTAMPRTTSGKKRYHALRGILSDVSDERVLERITLHTPTAAPSTDAIDIDAVDARFKAMRLIEAGLRAHGIDAVVQEHLRLVDDLRVDSLALYEIAVNLEIGLDTVINESALAEIATVGDLVELATRRSEADAQRGIRERIAHLTRSIPQAYRTVEQQVGRRLLIGGRWIADFASLNYLGFDVEPRVIASVAPMLEKWGTHPSWTRAVGSPLPYRQLEMELASLVGAHDAIVFPSISLLHLGVLPKLAGPEGTIFIDEGAHNSILEASELARARGATVVNVRSSDPADLQAKLVSAGARGPRVIACDGVYSMSGNIPTLREYAQLAARYDAILYVDDAHGLGVLGHDPSPQAPYGHGGSGVVRHLGLSYDNILYIGGLSKAFSSMAAFITCRDEADRTLAETASTMIFSGPIPVASLATGLEGLRLNRLDGDERRLHLWQLTDRLIRRARELGLIIDNDTGFPCVTVITGDVDNTIAAHQILWKHGILVTPAVFPAMPLNRGGVRISITSANTDEEVDQLTGALAEVAETIVVPTELSTVARKSGSVEF